MFNTKLSVWGVAIALVAFVTMASATYALSVKNESLQSKLTVANSEILGYIASEKAQRDKIASYNKLGEEHAKELTDAKNEIELLRDRLSNGPERVYVNADCPTVSTTDSATSSNDASAPQLTGAAREDYLRLREMMVENLQQTLYLQDYITTQCLGK
ncbi:lysis protein [Vibrio diazotrophicus]|uniref:lysis protein n=1 Tax=Vibrio diazotrophicus TaxID=685 RepID=UPI003D2F5B4B